MLQLKSTEERKMRKPRDLGESVPEKLEVEVELSKQLIGAYGEKAVEAQLLRQGWVDSDAKCNPVDSIGSSTKSRVSHPERRPSARFPGDKDGSARRNIEPLQ